MLSGPLPNTNGEAPVVRALSSGKHSGWRLAVNWTRPSVCWRKPGTRRRPGSRAGRHCSWRSGIVGEELVTRPVRSCRTS